MSVEPIPAKPPMRGGKSALPIAFGGLAVTLDHSGAVWLPSQRTLVVSDLHLEKGSGAAARGRLIPALDSRDTLARLKCVIGAYHPRRVVCLGDSFHDKRAGERMADADRGTLASLCASVGEWVWISGNHDPETPEFCDGKREAELRIEGVVLRHEPKAIREMPEIGGHFHPKTSVPAAGHSLTGRCFCVSRDLLIMPAFGAYAGGLHSSHEALRSLHRAEPKIFMLHASKIWRLA